VAKSADFPTNLDNVYIYLRKSREDAEAEERARKEGRGDDIETLARHRRALIELAYKNHHNVTQILEEVVSGEYISSRPEMMRLLEAVENEEVSAVWVMDLDRLGRGDMADQGMILRVFKDSETLILTPDKVYDLTDEMDEEWTEFKTFFARRELKMITKRMQRGRVASVMEGKFIGTRPPFGYDVGNDLILVPNKDADAVRKIFDLYVNGGIGSSKIAEYLNSRGIKTPTGKLWWAESVIAILRNEVYAGRILWKKVKHDKRKGTFHRRPDEEVIVAQGKHVPLIDEDTWQRSLKVRQGRVNAPVRTTQKVASALTGIVECGYCGMSMIRRPYTKQAAHLKCINPHCTQKSTRLSIVEERVIQALEKWLMDYQLTAEELASAISKQRASTLDTDSLLRSIDEDLERLNAQRDTLHDLLEQRVYDAATYLERNQKLMLEINTLRARRDIVVDDARKLAQVAQAKRDVIPRVINVLDAFHQTDDPATQNALLRTVINKAVYRKAKWQTGDQFELTIYPIIS